MKTYTRPFEILLLLLCLIHVSHATGLKPVSRAELLSLLAGDALPENIALEVQRRGISSALDGEFRKQLQRAGADASLLAILDHSKTASPVAEPATAQLEDLARAGELIRGHKYEDAADKLNEALKASLDGPEAPFVMAELLRRQEEWMKAAAVYDHLQQISPEFPQVDSKLSYIYFRLGDNEAAIHHGRRALELEPKDAEAHKNLGLVLEVERKFDAALAEYQEALLLKPDYANVHFDLGVLFYHQHKFEDAVTEYRKAIRLSPEMVDYHYNLGVVLRKMGQDGAAVLEYREAKWLDPKRIDVRINLASALNGLDANAAIAEFQELAKLDPSSLCHTCLAGALFNAHRLEESYHEYQEALRLDPTSSLAHTGLARLLESKGDVDGAKKQYEVAVQFDPRFAPAHEGLGSLALAKKDYETAINELKSAEDSDPTRGRIHQLIADAYAGAKNPDRAISEYKQAISFGVQHPEVKLKLAALLEAKSDYNGALEAYHQADVPGYPKGRTEYEAAKQRLAGRTTQGAVSPSVSAPSDSSNPSTAFHPNVNEVDKEWRAAIQDSQNASRLRQVEQEETALKRLVQIAETIQPPDSRLEMSISYLGQFYDMHNRPADAEVEFRKQLDLSRKLRGDDSPQNSFALMAMGRHFQRQKDYDTARGYLIQSLDLNEKAFSSTSPQLTQTLLALGELSTAAKDYDNAAKYFERALRIEEPLREPDDFSLIVTVERLATLYKESGQLEKSALFYRRMLAIEEKKFGADNRAICSALENLADALSKLGQNEEATQLRKRAQTLLVAQVTTH